MIIDMSLKNTDLYNSCEIEEIAGRLNLITPIDRAINIIGRNINTIHIDPDEVILTGPMAVWAYLVVFHSIVHRTNAVYYNDGRSGKFLIAKHG